MVWIHAINSRDLSSLQFQLELNPSVRNTDIVPLFHRYRTVIAPFLEACESRGRAGDGGRVGWGQRHFDVLVEAPLGKDIESP